MSQRREEGTWPVPAVVATVPALGSVALHRRGLRGGSLPRRRSRAAVPSCSPEGLVGTGELAPGLPKEGRRRRNAVHQLPWRKAEASGDGCAAAVKGAPAWKGERLPSPGGWDN